MRRGLRSGLAASAAAALLAAGGPALAAWDDMALGPRDAPVTVIEYASTTCSHCAHWDEDVFPAFSKKYIETGRVHYVLREFPTEPADLSISGFLLGRCAGPKYFIVLDVLWRTQEWLAKTGDGEGWLNGAGKVAGLTPQQTAACTTDGAALKAFNARLEENSKALDVRGTPTLFVNGKRVGEGGGPSLEELDKAIAAAEAEAAAKPAPRRKGG
jgi:protein-disulfide isomerase